ncbi:MAG TPA: hypothetical protein VF766_03855 [Pyrinomonadaceae bacterium]
MRNLRRHLKSLAEATSLSPQSNVCGVQVRRERNTEGMKDEG